jgi:hypothetical protein
MGLSISYIFYENTFAANNNICDYSHTYQIIIIMMKYLYWLLIYTAKSVVDSLHK